MVLAPAYQCPQDPEDRYFTPAKITSGGTQGSFTIYECVLHNLLFNNDRTCTYNVYGVSVPNLGVIRYVLTL
jgi:hypothetical protein